MNRTVLGIAGGTGSGKTYAAKSLLNEYPQDSILPISMDSYYLFGFDILRDLSVTFMYHLYQSISFN